jgi:hypothetical protein
MVNNSDREWSDGFKNGFVTGAGITIIIFLLLVSP